MKKRKLFLGVLLAAAAIGMTACDGPDPDDNATQQTDSGNQGGNENPVDPVVNKYIVSFDSKGGTLVASQEIDEGGKATRPANPSKASTAEYDYTFAGWYKDQALTQEFNFNTETINSAITLYAKWNEIAKGGQGQQETTYNVTFVSNGGTAVDRQQIVEGQTATEPTAPTKEHAQAADGYICKFMGWYSDFELTQPFDFSTPINSAKVLYAKWADYKTINSVEDFNAFRALTSSTENYLLTTDLDLKGVTLEGTANIFAGKFDGDGHVIKNAMYSENAANKSGILVRELANGAEITNIKFLNCTAAYQGETIGLVAGMVVGNIKFSNLEFNACVISANNYMGFLFGRVNATNTTVTADSITTKNGCRASATTYGGFLIGDIAGGASATDQNIITFTNMDIAGELKGGNLNGSFIFGRIRNNTKVTLENSVIRDAKLQSEKNDNGLFAGGGTTNGKNCNVNIKNVAILSTSGFTTLQSLGDLLKAESLAEGEFLTTYDLQNVYTPNGSTLSLGTAMPQNPTHNEVTALSVDATPAWLADTLGLDFTNTWMTEGENNAKYRLVASSTNVKSPDATLETISVTTANAQTRFKKGTDFTADGLVVSAVYSDGVQLILSPAEYTVTSTAFDKDTRGEYTIVVTGVEKDAAGQDVSTEYEVVVAEQTGFELDTQFTKLVYVQGEDLDLKNLLVYSNWSDGIDEKEANTKDVVRYTVDSTTFNKDVAGDYVISIAMDGFAAQTIHVSVIDTKPVAVDNNIYINVDADATLEYEGALVNGVETFTTITNAIDYLASANLGDVNKVIYVADGLYHEKITVPASLTNLKIIGESIENTIIDYDAVEGTTNPLNGTVYKMDCATIHVNATGFGLENITVQNSFNYIQDSSKYGDPQGFALTINADGAVLNNVHLYGNQDTLFFKSGRVYIANSLIEGNVDFIFGENNGLAFFDNCLINAVYRGNTNNTGYVTAMKGDTGATKPAYGYIFNNCVFTADGDDASILPENAVSQLYALTHNYGGEYDVNAGSMSLGRPWGGGATVSMINCYFTDAYSKLSYTTDDKTKSRWFSMSGNSPINADYSEFGSQGEGAITEEVTGGRILSATEAANYTAANLFAATNGGITWSSGAFDYATAYANLQSMATKTAGTAIVVKEENVTIFAGGTYDLTPYITPWNADNKAIVGVSGDDSIVTYANGIITGVTPGQSTTVTLTCGSLTKVINVTVQEGTFFAVTFVTDGTAVEAQNVLDGELIDPVETTLSGCKFIGWYKDAAYTQAFDATTTPITEAVTLYAKFVKQSVFDATNATSAGWTAYTVVADGDDTPMADTAKNYWLMFAEGGDNKTASPTADTVGAVATYKLATGSNYLEGVVAGYTKTVNVSLRGSTTSTGNGVILNVVAYDAAGNELVTKTVDVFAKDKVTEAASFTIESTTENIAYIRISCGTSGKNVGIVYAEMTYERNVDEKSNTFVTFGTTGNYETENDVIDISEATLSDPKTDGCKVAGTISVDVKAGGVVYVKSYQYYANFKFIVNGKETAFEKQSGYIQVTEDTTVTIESNGYLCGVYVLYQTSSDGWTFGSGKVSDELKVTLQKTALVTSDGLVSDATWSDGSSTTKIDYTNNTNYSQNNNHSFVLFVAPAGSKVTVVSYKGGISINGTAIGPNTDTSLGDNVTTVINVTAPTLIVIEATSNTYLQSITIE